MRCVSHFDSSDPASLLLHMLKLQREIGDDLLAKAYVADLDGHPVEFTESLQPPLPREKKWVLTISCMKGCPVRCLMCDAGGQCAGLWSKEQMFEQIDFMIRHRFPDGIVPVAKLKIQFARMGEPTFNPAVLEVLEELPQRYRVSGLLPSLSTIAPLHCKPFLERVLEIKQRLYAGGRFQMQFSIHTTDARKRDMLIPIRKLALTDIAAFGERFVSSGDRKITLNFIVMEDCPIDPAYLQSVFDPRQFLIKLTPLNPTRTARRNQLQSRMDPNAEDSVSDLVRDIASRGFTCLVSIGAPGENDIGSNCGQYVNSGEDCAYNPDVRRSIPIAVSARASQTE